MSSLLWLSEEAELVRQLSHPPYLLLLRQTLELVELLAGQADLLLEDGGSVLARRFLALELLVAADSVVVVHVVFFDDGSIVALGVLAVFVGQLDDTAHELQSLRGQGSCLGQLVLQEIEVLI